MLKILSNWVPGLTMLNQIARAAKDGELMLLVGPSGLGAICNENTFKIEQGDLRERPTAYTGIGPYYRSGAPERELGSSVVSGFENADHVLMHGNVTDAQTGAPIPNAELDLWQAGDNGLYDHEDPDQPMWNLRGRFITSKDGTYSLRCLRPTPYPIPTKGTAGELLRLLDRHPMRPGHIHFKVTAEGYLPLITELYEVNDKYLDSDVVFDVHDSVILQFERRAQHDGDKCGFELNYDFKIISKALAEERGMKAAEESIEATLDPY